jgi:YHS domain-containing protein
MLRFVILAAVAYIFYRALKNWMAGGGSVDDRRRTADGEVDDVLIQDPVCLTYFARRNGVHLHHQGHDLYFCSQACRERYLLEQAPPDDRADRS